MRYFALPFILATVAFVSAIAGAEPASADTCGVISVPWSTGGDDRDCDGFQSNDEDSAGTLKFVTCPVTTTSNDEDPDAWPADFDDNQVVNILDVSQLLPPTYGTTAPPTAARKDIVADGVINIQDLYKVLPPVFGQNCRIAPAAPAASRSRYVQTADPTTLSLMGCEQGHEGEVGVAVLAFGQPAINAGLYGTHLFDDNATFVSVGQIATAAIYFASGYAQCSPLGSSLVMVIGTSNYLGATGFAHGAAWAQTVNNVNSYIQALGIQDKVDARGGSDIEMDWSGPVATRAWVDGYDSQNLWTYYDFGDAGGCNPVSSGNDACNNGWMKEDVYYVSWGAAPARPLPDIYLTDGVHAAQWQNLSLYSYTHYGSAMSFIGSFTQWQACQDRPGDPQCLAGADNQPAPGWTQLWILLNWHLGTAGSVPYATDVTWQPEPE